MGLVTLITDASYDQHTGYAGWGAWARGDVDGSQGWSGPVIGVDSAPAAELVATLEGYRRVVQTWPHATVLLQSDCQRALMLLRWRFLFGCSKHPDGMFVCYKRDMRPTSCEAEILANWAEAWHHQGVVLVRHVKGHTKESQGGRYWVNRKVDRLAREAMRSQRELGHGQRLEAGADRQRGHGTA